MTRLAAIKRRLRRFLREDAGTVTVWSLFLFLTASCLGGFAVDVTHFYAVRTELQVAADNAARAAIFRRNNGASAGQARLDALAVARFSLPPLTNGNAIREADIAFGRYDAATERFVPDPSSRDAVLVTMGRTDSRGNPTPSFLLRFAGLGAVDINVASIAVSAVPACLTEGLTANGVVDTRSNNAWRRGFCMHSNSHVEVNQNSVFEEGVIVSMPDLDDFVMPASGFQQNEGLERALRSNTIEIGILDWIRPTGVTPLETSLLTDGGQFRPSYITSATVGTVSPSGNLVPGSFTQGQVHRATCSGNQSLTFKPANSGPTIYSRFVLITNCAISFDGRVDLQDVLIYTTNTSDQSIKSSSGGGSAFNVGRADACGAGGGAQIVTRGGVKSSAKMTLNGGQIIALGDVQFSAQGGGGFGASIVADGEISGTSNLEFSGCGGSGMEGNLNLRGFRLAR